MKRDVVLVVALSIAVGIAVVPERAEACGCFIDNTSTVDQTAERIIYLIEDIEKTGLSETTAIIQIQYEGGSEDFGWILPVPALPSEVAVYDGEVFNMLDEATAPALWGPPLNRGGGGFACFPASRGIAGGDLESGVQIWGGGEIGPFEYVILNGNSSLEVLSWLDANGYAIPAGTEGTLDSYLDAGFFFVVLKLLPGAGADTIQPIGVTYPGDEPCVPLRLTALGAADNMGLLLFVIGPERYRPTNYAEFTIEDSTIVLTPSGSNYLKRVEEEADLAGGRAFITEFARPANQVYVYTKEATELLDRGAFFTRMYTRISPGEMIADPLFERAGFDEVDNNHYDVVWVDNKGAGFSGTWFVLFAVGALLLGLRRLVARRARARD